MYFYGGDCMILVIPVSRHEILSRFAGTQQCYKLFINCILRLHVKRFILARRDPSFVQPGSCFAGTKFSHVIVSARLGGMKNLIKKYPQKYTSIDRRYFYWIQSILQHECKTRATQVRYECDTNNTIATQVQHECYTNDTSMTRVRNFDFDSGTSENIFLHPYISYMANEKLQEEEQFHFKNYFLEMPRSHTKMHLKSAPQKLNLVIVNARSKSYTLDCSCKCPCTFPHCYAQLHCLVFDKNYFI